MVSVWLFSFQSLDQCHRRGRSAYFAFVDKIHKDIARLRLGSMFLVDGGEVVRRAPLCPGFGALCPSIDLLWWIAGFHAVFTLLQPRIDKIGGNVGDLWIGVVLGITDCGRIFACERDKLRRQERVMTHFHDMPQVHATM